VEDNYALIVYNKKVISNLNKILLIDNISITTLTYSIDLNTSQRFISRPFN